MSLKFPCSQSSELLQQTGGRGRAPVLLRHDRGARLGLGRQEPPGADAEALHLHGELPRSLLRPETQGRHNNNRESEEMEKERKPA